MKIAELVRTFIPKIIDYCENIDYEELTHLQDLNYSKEKFGIGFPFWSMIENIESSKRYWKSIYEIDQKKFRVSSQWFARNIDAFKIYLVEKKISTKEDLDKLDVECELKHNTILDRKIRRNSRYRGNAIGNAQNMVIRNILSNIGDEQFSENDWEESKAFFGHRCAYCGCDEKLILEHALPINKNMLGEHRLGNLVPSCHNCNMNKGSKSYKYFLTDEAKIEKIEEYMKLKSYEPLVNHDKSEIISELLEKAYLETAEVAKRYIDIIELIQNDKK